MKIQEKLKIIQDKHFGEWIKTRQEVENELSNLQSVFCLCGRLATGLHESHCSKFKSKVMQKSLERLNYLLIAK